MSENVKVSNGRVRKSLKALSSLAIGTGVPIVVKSALSGVAKSGGNPWVAAAHTIGEVAITFAVTTKVIDTVNEKVDETSDSVARIHSEMKKRESELKGETPESEDENK